MGSEMMPPGKRGAREYASASDSATPGKSTQVERSYEGGQWPASYTQGLAGPSVTKTGNDGIDNAGKGKAQFAGDNFLTDQQRPILIAEYVGRVNASLMAYEDALISAQMEKLTEKEEEFPILGTLLLVAGGKGVESVLMGACKLLRAGGAAAERLGEIGVRGIEGAKVEQKMLGLSEKSVELLVSQATDQAKEKIKGAAAGALGAEQATKKGQALSFIAFMKDAAFKLFQRFREWPIGRASDTQLLALMEAFSAERQLPSMYQRHVNEIVELYARSHAREIGAKTETGVGEKTGRIADTRTETRVAMVAIGSNPPMEAYVRQKFEAGVDGKIDPSVTESLVNASANAVGLNEDGEVEFLGWVEPELREVAKATHEQRWLHAPKTYTMSLPRIDLKGQP
jgi:hypothetical protein